MKKIFSILLLIVLLASCEDKSDWDIKTASNDYVVVDAIITSEFKFQTIVLSKPVKTINGKPEPVSGATVIISSSQQVYNFHENPAQAGNYISDIEFAGIRNRTYSVSITAGNKVFSAKAVLEPPALLTDLAGIPYQQVNDSMYRLTKSPNNYNPAKPAMFEIVLDWSKVSGYQNEDSASCRVKLFFYSLPTIDVSEVFAPLLEKVWFPKATVITQRRYSLTDEHAAFLRAMLLETTWTGGYFDTAPANVPTNMSDGALGFFGACGVVEKQEIVK